MFSPQKEYYNHVRQWLCNSFDCSNHFTIVYQTITLYTLNICNVIYQLYLQESCTKCLRVYVINWKSTRQFRTTSSTKLLHVIAFDYSQEHPCVFKVKFFNTEKTKSPTEHRTGSMFFCLVYLASSVDHWNDFFSILAESLLVNFPHFLFPTAVPLLRLLITESKRADYQRKN